MVETQLCKLRDASDALIGRACAMFHLPYLVVYNIQDNIDGVCELHLSTIRWLLMLSSTSFTVGRSRVFFMYSSWKIWVGGFGYRLLRLHKQKLKINKQPTLQSTEYTEHELKTLFSSTPPTPNLSAIILLQCTYHLHTRGVRKKNPTPHSNFFGGVLLSRGPEIDLLSSACWLHVDGGFCYASFHNKRTTAISRTSILAVLCGVFMSLLFRRVRCFYRADKQRNALKYKIRIHATINTAVVIKQFTRWRSCLLYTSPSPRD